MRRAVRRLPLHSAMRGEARTAAGAAAEPPATEHGHEYDLFVVGVGSGGMRAARMAKPARPQAGAG